MSLPPPNYNLVYSEDFTGSSLPSPWSLGYYFSNTVPGSAVTVSGGALHLTWTRGGVSDISVSSSATYRYGYFEVRMKWTTDVGAWPAIWFIPPAGIQHTGEIDLFEGQGNDHAAFFATLHEWNGSSQLWQSSPNRFPVSGIDFTQYHTYGLLWEPGGNFTWYLDGVVILVITGAPSIFDTQSVFPILSMQEGNNWSPGNLSGVSASTLTADIDYYHIYQLGAPPVGSPTITSFTASPTTVNPGATATLSWVESGATSLSIDNGVGPVTGTSQTVTVDATTTFILTATNGSGSTSRSVTVTVSGVTLPPVISSFTASSTSISAGTSVTLTFALSGAASASILPGVGPVSVSGGTASVTPLTDTVYILVASSQAGTTTAFVIISVTPPTGQNVEFHQVRQGDREGDGELFQMKGAGPDTPNWPAFYDGGKNINASQPRGNTTVVQMADQTLGFVQGNFLAFDPKGNSKDSGVSSATLRVQIYHIASFVGGQPDASELVLEWTCPSDLTGGVSFVADLATSSGRPKVNPTSSAVYTIKKISSNSTTETSIGTITVATSGVATFSTSGTAYTFLPGASGDTPRGDMLRVYAPSSQDATLSDFGFVLAGTRE